MGNTDWNRLRNMTDEEIEKNAMEDPDALPMTREEWSSAEVVMPENKDAAVKLRLKPSTLNWFRSKGKGYQTLMTSVLESYMQHEEKKRAH